MSTIASPAIANDQFAEEYTFWTDGATVKFSTNLRPDPITAFSQPVEHNPIDVVIGATGEISVTYLDDEGNRLTQSSQRDGDSGTWS